MFSLDQLENLLEQEEQEKGGNDTHTQDTKQTAPDNRTERDASREKERRKHSSKHR